MKQCYLCKNDLKEARVGVPQKYIRHNCYNVKKDIIKCPLCHLLQLTPQWKEKDLEKIYENYSIKEDFKGYKQKPREYPTYIDKYLKKTDTILEVGCGLGTNIKRLKKLGYRIFGIDKDKSVCNLGNDIYNVDVKELAFYAGVYDIIYAIHFLEHLKNPMKFINDSYTALTKSGKLILELPNADEPLLSIYNNTEFYKYYWRPDHLFFFTPNTLQTLISNTLFGGNCKIILKQKYGLFNHLNWLFRRKPTNININIPILDTVYKFILTKIFKRSDSLIVILTKD